MFSSIRDIIDQIVIFNDGDGERPSGRPSDLTLDNSDKFLNTIPGYYKKILEVEEIQFTPHGTVTIDWYSRRNFVSVEIGQTQIGFFSELPDGTNPSATLQFDGKAPEMVVIALNKLYGRSDSTGIPAPLTR
jgi:hypothetical protein